ncbi:MAG: PQQ-binding-like beta-propeller repeat protein [Fuerstiella sp.]|nr:PQQ-binding-like beta-propeller repeat protein [Fuerstiella sp.]
MLSITHRLLPLFLIVACACRVQSADRDWSGWRGPLQNGHATEQGLPVKWGPESVVWKTPLPGRGQSSPVVSGDRLFLTSALEDGRQRVVMGIDRRNGSVLWSHVAWTGEPEKSHGMNGWASATCVTDGARVYAFFGRGGGLFCYSVDGQLLWNKDLGRFEGPWGTAAGPLLVRDMVIQNCDADADAFIVGLDKTTGEEIWRTKREDARGWSTPILINVDGHDEVVVNGHHGVRAYDPQTGKELWFCKGFSGRGTPTVTPAGDLLHVLCGLRGDTYAVRPGGSGDVTDTHMVWHSPRNSSRDLPSPIVVGGNSLVMDMRRATLTAYDVTSGEEKWRRRVAEAATIGQFCATPVTWDGVAFFVSEKGQVFAIKPGADMEIVAVNQVGSHADEIFRASITPSSGQLFLRSDRVLYCIGARAKQ